MRPWSNADSFLEDLLRDRDRLLEELLLESSSSSSVLLERDVNGSFPAAASRRGSKDMISF
jgi:hypothetical protein